MTSSFVPSTVLVKVIVGRVFAFKSVADVFVKPVPVTVIWAL